MTTAKGRGLSQKEAQQSRDEHGSNIIPEKKGGSWLIILLRQLASPGSPDNPPSFAYWIFFSIFIFFNIFALNQYLQYKKIGKWSDYLYGERSYIILSFVAKSLLAWQVFAGTLRP